MSHGGLLKFQDKMRKEKNTKYQENVYDVHKIKRQNMITISFPDH